MPIQTDSLNRKLYDLLNSRGYNPVPRDCDVANAGKTVPPEEADVFKFTFKQGDKSIDDAWVSIDGANNLTLYYGKELADKAGQKTPGAQFDDSWYGLLKHLKQWAYSRQLSFQLEPKEKIDSDMAQRSYMKKKEQIAEGYYPMGKSASYNDNVPTVKIILQHTRQIHEGEQRYRNIAKIFLENTQGERFLAPTTKPGLAQVYARHLAEGGVPNDERWNHIKGLCEEYSKMAGFVRAVRGNQFNESAQKVVDAGLSHYQSLRESLSKMRGHRGYTTYFESYTPPLMEDDSDDNKLNELFVQETLDPRIESVMPILSKLSKNLGEMKEIDELAEWADKLIEGDGGQEALNPIGIPEGEDVSEGEIPPDHKGPKSSEVPAYLRKSQGKNFPADLEKEKERNISGPEGLAALKKRAGIDQGVTEGADTLRPGSIVTVLYKGKMVPGKIVRYDAGKSGEAPAYVVDVGQYESIFVPASKIEQGVAEGSDDNIDKQGKIISNRLYNKAYEYVADLKKWHNRDFDREFDQAVENVYYKLVSNFVNKNPEYKEWFYSNKKQGMTEGDKPGLWANIHAKQNRIKHGSGEKMRKPGSKGAPTSQNFKDAAKEDVEENLDSNQKRVGQLGPTEKVKNNNIGKLVGANESFINTTQQAVTTEEGAAEGLNESHMSNIYVIMQELGSGVRDIYDTMNNPKTPEEKYVANILQEMYDTIAVDHHLHHDDDFEEIIDIMGDQLAHDYPEQQQVQEGQEDLDAILRIIRK